MSREKGTASYSANFEAEKAAPIDARMIVGTQADLFLEATWTANDGGVYVYKGMIVCVHSDATESNNGLYRLNNVDYTNSNNWIYVGSGGGPATDEKVKYNSGDPTAGYIADKIASGSGIIVAEGTSVNLNKLVITNADKGSVAISGHNSAFNHANIAHSNRTALNAVSGTNTGDQDSSDFNLANLADVDDSAKATGKILKVHSSGKHVYVDESSGNDEKVKINEDDPLAGYLQNKLVAGSGISIVEGTGDGEGTLIVTNTDKGSDVDLSGLLPDSHLTDFVHSDIAHANRSDLDLVSGTNTGDSSGHSNLLPDSHLTDFTHSDIAHANRSDLDNVSGTNTGDQVGDGVTITGAGTIADPFVAVGGSSADEKVKYDVNDPTAGYIVDKIIAGSGISIAEGTGANENKLEIINTDKGSDVDLSGLLPDSHLTDFTHSDIAHANRSDLDNVSGTNTGDSSGHSNLLPDSHLTDFTHSDIAHANRSDLDNVSGINTGDQEIYSTFGITTDGAGNTITTGEKGRLVMTYSGELKEWSITTKEGTSGSIAYIINKNGVTMIGAGTKPNLSSQATNSATITNWTSIVVAKGDIITFIVDSVASIDWVNLSITALKT